VADSEVTLAYLYPELLATYGDRGNLEVAAFRLAARGLSVRALQVGAGDTVPSKADVYFLGGGEDQAQVAACELLKAQRGFRQAVESGAVVLAVCAGFQLLGEYFLAGQERVEGLGLVPARTHRLKRRAVGEIAARRAEGGGWLLSGFENHMGATEIAPPARPLSVVLSGTGNGMGGCEGLVMGNVFCTYMHGPALARNPELADEILERATGTEMEPLEGVDALARELKAERLRAALGRGGPRLWRWLAHGKGAGHVARHGPAGRHERPSVAQVPSDAVGRP
jgi:CobQ-like glutamine amidotransferase family enzyme